MANATIDKVDGEVISPAGTLQSVVMTAVPAGYSPDYFTLVQEIDGGEVTLINVHISSSSITAGSELLSGGNIAYTNLKAKSVPEGAVFDLTFEEAPVEEPSAEDAE